MKIGFNPHAAAQAQSARGPQAQTTPPAPEGSDDGVTITLSQAAQSILKTGGPGKSGDSPAHMAAAAVGAEEHTGPFGQLVKAFTPGYVAPEAVGESDAVPEDGGATGETGTTDGGGTTVVEGSGGTGIGATDPAVGAEGPDVTEVPDESEPTDGETSEPESGLAGSGDAVALAGDGAQSDGTVGDAGAPVAAVDAGDVTDELLDLLDENGAEVV